MGVRACPGSGSWTRRFVGIVCASGLALALSSGSVFAQAGASSTPATDCGFCLDLSRQLEAPADRAAALELCHVLSGALGQLGQYRSAFLDDPHYVDLFPLIYWHVTRIEMQRLHDREFSYPIEKMQQMLMYLDAYIVSRAHWFANRGGERHWQRHLAAAMDADEDSEGIGHGMAFDTPALIDQVLTLGNSAHVEFDFPRAIRDSFVHRHHPMLTADELHPDSVKTNDT